MNRQRAASLEGRTYVRSPLSVLVSLPLIASCAGATVAGGSTDPCATSFLEWRSADTMSAEPARLRPPPLAPRPPRALIDACVGSVQRNRPACDRGEAGACFALAAARYVRGHDALTRSLFARSCRAGHLEACASLGEMSLRSAPLDRACDGGVARACVLGARIESRISRSSWHRRGCEHGAVTSCVEIVDGLPPEERLRLLEPICEEDEVVWRRQRACERAVATRLEELDVPWDPERTRALDLEDRTREALETLRARHYDGSGPHPQAALELLGSPSEDAAELALREAVRACIDDGCAPVCAVGRERLEAALRAACDVEVPPPRRRMEALRGPASRACLAEGNLLAGACGAQSPDCAFAAYRRACGHLLRPHEDAPACVRFLELVSERGGAELSTPAACAGPIPVRAAVLAARTLPELRAALVAATDPSDQLFIGRRVLPGVPAVRDDGSWIVPFEHYSWNLVVVRAEAAGPHYFYRPHSGARPHEAMIRAFDQMARALADARPVEQLIFSRGGDRPGPHLSYPDELPYDAIVLWDGETVLGQRRFDRGGCGSEFRGAFDPRTGRFLIHFMPDGNPDCGSTGTGDYWQGQHDALIASPDAAGADAEE